MKNSKLEELKRYYSKKGALAKAKAPKDFYNDIPKACIGIGKKTDITQLTEFKGLSL